MNYYDYVTAVREDATKFIYDSFASGYYDTNTDIEDVCDDLFIDDAVTGNCSGSYTFNVAKAKENVSEAIWDEDVRNALAENGSHVDDFLDSPETLDVAIRCAVLGQVYSDIESTFRQCQQFIAEDE